jgi:hypothetical protein
LDLGAECGDRTGGQEKSQGAGGEEKQGGWLGNGGRVWRGCLRGDGEVVVIGAIDGVSEVDQPVGAGIDGGGVEVAGGGDEGDEYGAGEGDVVEDQALAGVADVGEEGDIELVAADSVDGSGGGERGKGDEVGRDSEGELLRQGEGVGVGVAGDGEEVDGVGVGGYGQSGGEDEEFGEEVTHGISLRYGMRAFGVMMPWYGERSQENG